MSDEEDVAMDSDCETDSNYSSSFEEEFVKSLSINSNSNPIVDDDSDHDTGVHDHDDSSSSIDTGLTNSQSENPTEIRRKFNELIEKVQEYKEKDGIEEDLEEKMTRNIRTGRKLFDKLGACGPKDMYMALVHTKVCSDVVLSKTGKIGCSKSGFRLDVFLNSLQERCQEERDEYTPENAVLMIAQEANRAQRILPTLVSILGAFDRSLIAKPPEVKEKKQRATPRKKDFDGCAERATQHEQVSESEEQRALKKKDSPEGQSRKLLKFLHKHHEMTKVPTNIVEFTMDRDSLENYTKKLFYVAFLARDGHISIVRKKRKHSDDHRFDSDLYLAPEEPPQKLTGSQADDSIPRHQHIMSFNPRIFRALVRATRGPPLVTFPSARHSEPMDGEG